MKYLGDGLKQLSNLRHLVLGLYGNKLDKNKENFIYLADALKYLPDLNNLELYLQENGLGRNTELMQGLVKCI